MKAYAGRCEQCGYVIAIMAINNLRREDMANALAEWVRDGMTVEQMTVKEAQEAFTICDCKE